MRVSRIYYKDNLQVGESVSLNADTAHYLVNVLRLKEGNAIVLFNGNAGDIQGTIAAISKKEIIVDLNKQVVEPLQLPLFIHLGIGLSKGDRMDFAIQKSVELGVSEISPLYTEFGEVKLKESKRLENKLRHWQRIAVSACEQCGSHSPPEIHVPSSFNAFVESQSVATKLILDASGEKNLTKVEVASSVVMLVGPEGGFSNNELDAAKNHEYETVNLGQRILRTETAPVAALAILQNLYGN